MRFLSSVGVVFLLILTTGVVAQDKYGCSKKALEIRERSEDGSTVRLEFGSLWAVEQSDWVHTRIWLRLERVHVCKNGLRKENSQTVINATRIG